MRKIDLSNFQVATSGTARAINRRIVLNLVRRHGPISRADLARRSGLQRSTITAIIRELIADRWVLEGAVGHLPRGRKPTFLHLNADRAGIIGIVVRPTGTTIGLARLDTSFIAQTSLRTEGTAAQFVSSLSRRVCGLIESYPQVSVGGIGVSLPGRVDAHTQKLVFAPNLKWRNLDLKTPLERATGLRVELENAANACALAESWCGAHPPKVRNLIVVTVSEGIGVAMILNGQLVRGADGMAGEFGHVSLDENGPLCNCGNRGCWEVFASNPAAVNWYTQAVRARGKGAAGRSMISFANLLARLKRGDSKAVEALNRMGHYLGAGLAMLVNGFAPDAIVVVGEVMEVWDRVAPVIQAAIENRCPSWMIPRIVPTDPARLPRLRGAVVLVLQKDFGAPRFV